MVYHQNIHDIFMNNEFVYEIPFCLRIIIIIISYKKQLNFLQLMHVGQVINGMSNNLLNNVHGYGKMEDNYVKQLV
jgi:hypothetical protein